MSRVSDAAPAPSPAAETRGAASSSSRDAASTVTSIAAGGERSAGLILGVVNCRPAGSVAIVCIR